MFVKDPFLHSTYSKEGSLSFGKRIAILKSEVVCYEECDYGTMVICLNAELPVYIAMPYDEVKVALTVMVC